MSPITALKKLDFPAPTSPTMQTNDPFSIVTSNSFSAKNSERGLGISGLTGLISCFGVLAARRPLLPPLNG